MTQSMFEKVLKGHDYWFRVMDIERVGTLVWHLTPNANWPAGRSFGFHFSRDCLSLDTPCSFRPIEGTASYRLAYPQAIDGPEQHDRVLEAALWARLTAL